MPSYSMLWHQNRIRINSLHSLVVKMAVQKIIQRGGLRGGIGMALGISGKRQRGDGHIEQHEYNEYIHQDGSEALRKLFDPSGQHRIDRLQPYHGSNAPEEAIEQVDASTQVEGEAAVVPEYRAENQLGKHAADIFICAPKQCACKKDVPVALIAVAVQKQSQQGTAQPPDNAEGTVHHAAAAHEDAHGQQAENGLGEVSQKGADEKKRSQLVKTAALRKDSAVFAGALFPKAVFQVFRGDSRKGSDHTPLYEGGQLVFQKL